MSLHDLVAQGGKVVVVGGTWHRGWEPYLKEPRVAFWTGDRKEIERRAKDGLPSNTHALIISRFVSHTTTISLVEEARKKQIVIMGPFSDAEVTRKLNNIFDRTEPVETKEQVQHAEAPVVKTKDTREARKGEVSEYVKKHYDATIPVKDAVARIGQRMLDDGIVAKPFTVQNAVYMLRSQLGVGKQPVAKAAQPKVRKEEPKEAITATSSPMDDTETLLKMIDDAGTKLSDLEAALTLMKDEVRRMHAKNVEYRVLEETLSKLGYIKK